MKTFSVDQVCEKIKLHDRRIVVAALRRLHIDPTVPIEEIDAIALAEELNREWSVKEE